MSTVKHIVNTWCIGIFCMTLSACYQPPHNHFQPYSSVISGSTDTKVRVGSRINKNNMFSSKHENLIKELENQDVQYVQYGDTNTLIVPTDKYFEINSNELNDLAYPGLANIVTLLKSYPNSEVYIGGFTDDIGSDEYKKHLTQARAEAMLTYLWAHKVPAKYLKAEGYSDKHAVANNLLIHGSAHNRRLEIQWFTKREESKFPLYAFGRSK